MNIRFFVLPLLFATSLVFAADKPNASSPQSEKEMKNISLKMVKVLGGKSPTRIERSVVTGLYEVFVGPKLFYITPDAKYIVQGNVMDLDTMEDVTEPRMATARLKAIESVGEDSMLVYPPKGETKHTVTVFTDIDCPYCKKLHSEVPAMNDAHIKVRYLLMPRAGKDTPSYQKAVSAWCGENPQKAYTDSINGEFVEQKTCTNPVDKHMTLATEMSIAGTPAIILESGTMIPGYVPASRLIEMLDKEKSGKKVSP